MVLKQRNRVVVAFVLLEVALFVSLFGGCGVFAPRPAADGFDHAVHARQGITCDACHHGYVTDEAARMPTYGVCFACHGPDEERAPYPYETALQAHERGAEFVAAPRFADLVFSHAVHLEREIGCEECHTHIDAGAAAASATEVESCRGCHRAQGLAGGCDVCHREIRAEEPPPSHAGEMWMRTHGREARASAELAHGGCRECHTRGSCDGCHQVEKPQDHTEFFRLSGHGLRAGIERERCAACHQESFCIRCHQETAPRSHRMASWGGAQSNHCVRCHEPLGESRCSVCHRTTPSHLAATPIPPPPHPRATSDCYRCHLRPPHADNRLLPCTACHR